MHDVWESWPQQLHMLALAECARRLDCGYRPEADIQQRIEMTNMELAVYSDTSNHAVVATPGRLFPGSVIQGDSLASLCDEVRRVALWVEAHTARDDDVRWTVQEIQQQLLDRLLHYQGILQANGIALPYGTPAERGDLVALVDLGG